MFIALSIILGLSIGALSVYFVMRPKIKAAQQLDQEIMQKNIEMNERWENVSNEVSALEMTRNQLNMAIEDLVNTQQKSANAVYEACMNEMQEKLSAAAERASRNYEYSERQAQEEYLKILEDSVLEYKEAFRERADKLLEMEAKLADMKAITDAAVEANRRAQEMENQQDFYRLILTEIDLLEIERLREVAPFLRDSEPLNKVIWKVYYEKPYTDLVGRVVGKNTKTGIYKITNLKNGMCYVGQAVNIADRWRQHIKRGIGAEAPTRNKLYPVMLSTGVENFSFEIIEECDRGLLNEREDYWQDYFQAKEFGYSIK